MTSTEAPAFKTIDRAPREGDIITVTPLMGRLFHVDALDDLYGEFILCHPVDSIEAPQWRSMTHLKVIERGQPGTECLCEDLDDEPDDTCHCGHPDCGAC